MTAASTRFADLPDLMGFVGSVLGARLDEVAAGGSALSGSDPLVEVWRQTVRPLVARDVPLLGWRAPETLG
jgi:hypothetical protein